MFPGWPTTPFENITSTFTNDTMVQWPHEAVNYCHFGPSPEMDLLDERHNEKAWARWFREFLEELLPASVYIPRAIRGAVCRYIYQPVVRSGTQFREWKMKRWKQAYDCHLA